MKTIKRWLANIKWLFNNPCTHLKNDTVYRACDYCGKSNGNLWNSDGCYTICGHCQKKVYDKVLGNKIFTVKTKETP